MIVTISRQAGSGGDEIALALAEERGYSYIDRDTIKEKLLLYNIPETLIDRYDEKKPGYWSSFSEKKERYLNNLKKVILEFAVADDCVLIGRGAQVLLGDVPGVVRVRITAPSTKCRKKISEEHGCSQKEAEKIRVHINNERKGFYHSFFNVEQESSDLYDLIINTRHLDVDEAVGIIWSIIELKKGMECSLDDLVLKQKIIDELLYIKKIAVNDLNVAVEKGIVTLIGTVLESENIDLCRSVVKNLPGVESVNTEGIIFMNSTPYGI